VKRAVLPNKYKARSAKSQSNSGHQIRNPKQRQKAGCLANIAKICKPPLLPASLFYHSYGIFSPQTLQIFHISPHLSAIGFRLSPDLFRRKISKISRSREKSFLKLCISTAEDEGDEAPRVSVGNSKAAAFTAADDKPRDSSRGCL
jgi:hypothetical protein